MKKILHITNWYPNKWNNIEALFIQEQFKIFSEVFDGKIIHTEVRYDSTWFRYESINYSSKEQGYYIFTKFKSFLLIELITSFLLLWSLFKSKYEYDMLHIHIAYPLLSHYHTWKRIIKKPIILSEHWSAYHFNFYMPKTTHKLERIKRIFKQNIPVITVSKSLLKDIQNFANTDDFPAIIIANVVDNNVYYFSNKGLKKNKPVFFIINFWRKIKQPFPMLEAFAQLAEKRIDFELRIGGYGDLLDDMKRFVSDKKLESVIIFLGKMDKTEIAKELINSNAYLLSSDYETFSVACAQALSCGCPIIAPAIPAILEYATAEDMITVQENTAEGWQNALVYFINKKEFFNSQEIAQRAVDFFSHTRIKKQYKAWCDAYF